MRIFLAVFPPPGTQQAAHRLIEKLRRPGDGISWVRRENLHFTLRFLGELGEDGARRVADAALQAAAAHRVFDVTLGSPGAFPSARRARVLWLGLLEGAEPFVRLAAALDRTLASRGFEPEGREFSPHLTLGRVRGSSQDWTDDLHRAKGVDSESLGRFTVDAIRVVRSTLSPQGSTYEVLESASLGT